MKTLRDIGVEKFESNIENFNYYISEQDTVRDICLYSIGLKNQLDILNIPWIGKPYRVYLAQALAYVVSPLIESKVESSIFMFILDTDSLSDVIDAVPSLETEFRPLVELSKSIQNHFDEEWCKEFCDKEQAKVANTPINDQPINTVKDLLNLLNQIVVKDMLIDDFRVQKQSPVFYGTDFSTGVLRIEQNKKEHPEFTGFIDCVMSSSLTVNKFINMLSVVPPETWIHSIRLKGSNNMVYMTVEKDGLVICD
ncbi:hypothetical protein [Aeromonas phage AerS_266]|nr:hypothetical protein [Aeromonas phage AerS_266]